MAEKKKPYTLGADEKATPAMVYTLNSLAWGDVITKEAVRVSTYLRTIAPDYVSLYDAHAFLLGGDLGRPLAFPELHIRTAQVLAFHLLPPASDPPDYDPAELNRKMEPVTVLVGPFRFDALLRISTMTTLAKHVEITTDVFISLYDATMSCPIAPSLGVVRTPLVLIRRDMAQFAARLG